MSAGRGAQARSAADLREDLEQQGRGRPDGGNARYEADGRERQGDVGGAQANQPQRQYRDEQELLSSYTEEDLRERQARIEAAGEKVNAGGTANAKADQQAEGKTEQTNETDKGVAMFSHADRSAVEIAMRRMDNADELPYPLFKDQSAVKRLNDGLADHFQDPAWRNAYVQRDLPDSLNAFAKAARAAFGTQVVGITATEPRFNQFNGINYRGTIYVNLDGNRNFINIAGHEIYHSLEKDRPDLHQWFVEQARRYRVRIGRWAARVRRWQPIATALRMIRCNFLFRSPAATTFQPQPTVRKPSWLRGLTSRTLARHTDKTENREATEGQKREIGRGAAREANQRRPASTGVSGRRKKARNEFGLLEMVVDFNRKPNPHISSLSAPVGSLETLARFRGRISRNRTCP